MTRNKNQNRNLGSGNKLRAPDGNLGEAVYDQAAQDKLFDPDIPPSEAEANPPTATTLEMQEGTETALRSVSPSLVADAITAQANNPQQVSWFIPIKGVTDPEFIITGEHRVIATGLVADYVTSFSSGNTHVAIVVNSITTGGIITITGTAVDETTGVPNATTEDITVDTSVAQHYHTAKKWLEITSVDVSGTTGIDYGIEVTGFADFGNSDFTIIGYRAEMRATGNDPDLAFRIRKIQDDGSGKYSVVLVEHIGIDSTASDGSVIDSLRTGPDDRSFTFGQEAFDNDTVFTFKQLDFSTYFVADENVIEGETKNEGIIIDLLGAPSGGISNIDHVTVTIFYSID